MSFARAVKRRVRTAAVPVLFLALVGYFLWNATQGDRGLKARAARNQDLITAQTGLAHARDEQATWEHRVASLGAERLDLDALDERARALLNLTAPDDVVILYPPGNKLY